MSAALVDWQVRGFHPKVALCMHEAMRGAAPMGLTPGAEAAAERRCAEAVRAPLPGAATEASLRADGQSKQREASLQTDGRSDESRRFGS